MLPFCGCEARGQAFHWFIWVGEMFEFQCLPFGLSNALRVFTKQLKPVVAFLRRQGIRQEIFLGDMIVLAQLKEDLKAQMNQITSLSPTGRNHSWSS